MGMIAIFGVVYSLGGELARNNQRLDTIEAARLQARTENQAVLSSLASEVNVLKQSLAQVEAKLPTIDYRLTINEQKVVEFNARMDRFADAIGGLRDAIAKISTAIEVLGQKLDSKMPGTPGSGSQM